MNATHTISAAQLRAMQAGRERAARERRKNAKRRVRAWRAWLAEGSPTRRIPEVPTDADYKMVNER